MRVSTLRNALDRFVEPWRLSPENVLEHRMRLEQLKTSLEGARLTMAAIRELCGAAATHPDPWLRQAAVQTAVRIAPSEAEVAAAVVWLTHDPEDFVCFEAVRAAARLRLRDALPHLLVLVGDASTRLHERPGKPVGIGHALVLDAIVRIVGTADPAKLAEVEASVFRAESGDLPAIDGARPPERARGGHAHSDMRRIPTGKVSFRVPRALESGRVFDWTDVEQPSTINVDAFWIDRDPVTVAAYDRFAASDAARSHSFCHPSEPPEKLHVRNTLHDPRFGPAHPVAGVDWFDAYAYARWVGKRLPTEAEWQRAAQGDDDRAYPWGDEFDEVRAQSIGRVLGHPFFDLHVWRRDLLALSENTHAVLTVPAAELDGESPFGVRGLSGNTWEWTGSSFFSRGPADPDVGERDLLDLVYDWRSYPVIKGGSWSSPRELTSVGFRGRDLVTDRHCENGFRCACDCRDSNAGPR